MDEWTGELNLSACLQLKEIFHNAVLEWMEQVNG